MTRAPTERAHRDCWDYLPWAANGALDAVEYAQIERHLSDCAECQAELRLQLRIRETMRAEPSVVLAPQTSFQKLMQRIDAEEAALATARRSGASRSSFGRSRWLAVAAAVQGCALIFVAAAYWRAAPDELTAPRFHTLTEPAPVTGPVIRIVFAPEVAVDGVNEVVRSVGAQIVAGPSEAGVYTLALQARAESRTNVPADVQSALAQLRSDARVHFAEAAPVSAR
jgi:Putative zinc-finger